MISRIALRTAVCAMFAAGLSTFAVPGAANATPSTQIWIPSTDVQPFKTFHLNIDSYVRSRSNDDGSRTPPTWIIGPTVGVLPFEKVQAEVGFDLISQGGDLDKHPFYGHFKIGTPEDNTWKPAFAVGMYNIGMKSGDARKGELATNQDIAYGLAAKTIPFVGRFSAGYYVGNKKVLVTDETDGNGNLKSSSSGVLLSWDRTMSEISDKLWFAVDYMGGRNMNGALNFGFSWAFARNVSVIFGYDIYNNRKTGGQNTFTVQVDINFP